VVNDSPTLAEIMAFAESHSVRDEDSGCLIWVGAFSFGTCKANWMVDGKKRTINMRRTILEAKTGRPLGKLLATCKCGNERCIEPSHLTSMTRKQVQVRSSKLGLFRAPHVVAAKKAAGRKRSNLSMTDAREIRSAVSAGETQRAVAERKGLNQSTVWKIVHNRILAESAANASVFNWRPAA
jgi:hypothetical protein